MRGKILNDVKIDWCSWHGGRWRAELSGKIMNTKMKVKKKKSYVKKIQQIILK